LFNVENELGLMVEMWAALVWCHTGWNVGPLQSEWTGRCGVFVSSSVSECHLSGRSSSHIWVPHAQLLTLGLFHSCLFFRACWLCFSLALSEVYLRKHFMYVQQCQRSHLSFYL